jgi:hypothetical protein
MKYEKEEEKGFELGVLREMESVYIFLAQGREGG